jgi:hypothetical protein
MEKTLVFVLRSIVDIDAASTVLGKNIEFSVSKCSQYAVDMVQLDSWQKLE